VKVPDPAAMDWSEGLMRVWGVLISEWGRSPTARAFLQN
jgi:hypothetical protein